MQWFKGLGYDFRFSKNPLMEIIENFKITNVKNSPCNRMLFEERDLPLLNQNDQMKLRSGVAKLFFIIIL